jgi:polysaccharide pyruvyl transferase CsaB
VAKILLLGYFGAGNFGDEALLADWLIRQGRQLRDNNFEIDVVVRDQELFQGMPSSERLQSMISSEIPQKAALQLNPRDYRALILPGGSVLQDSSSLKSLLYYLWFLRRFTQSPCRVVLLNQGIGPISSWLGNLLAPIVLRAGDYLSLRDEQSLEWARSKRLDTAHCEIRHSCDPILFYDQPPLPGFDRTLLPERYFVYIPRRSRDLPAPDDLSTEAQAAARLIQHTKSVTGLPCVIVPFALREDLEFAREIERESVGDASLPGDLSQRLPDAWTITRSAELVISSRLHGLIAAAGACIPSLGIALDPKISQIATELGCPWCFPATQHREDSFRIIDDLWEHRAHVRTHLEDRLQEMHIRLNKSDSRYRQLI